MPIWNPADTVPALAITPAILGVILAIVAVVLSHRKAVLKLRAAQYDPAHLQMLTETARRMEQRIFHLESILDHEAPGWRSRGAQDGRVDVAH